MAKDKAEMISKVAREFSRAQLFNYGIQLYETVKTNENFFIGKQWEGVQSNGLPTPVFNFLKRVVLFSVANVSTDNLKLHAKPLPSSGVENATLEQLTSILNDQFAAIFEHNKMGTLIREFCRNAAVDGDGCLYAYWDDGIETGQESKGGIRIESLQNTQVMFGNPNSRDVQSQPYIIIERRMVLKDAKRYAKANKSPDVNSITPDTRQTGNSTIDALGGNKVSVFLRMWKDRDTKTVHCYECTANAEIRAEWDLGIKSYPLVWMNWDYIQDNYHGQAMISGLIPNQIFVNKLYAMAMISLMTLAFPKVIYNKTIINKWSSKVGAAIGVNGNVDGAAKIIDPASISPQISQFIQQAISDTQKFLGASDVALGDTRPDNTSAIIALQRAAATPNEITKQNVLNSVEEIGRICIEFEGEYYGERNVEVEVEDPITGVKSKQTILFDYKQLKSVPMSIDLDAGASTYWSEIANMQTLDNLLMQGKIPTSEYLKRLPQGQITDKEALIAVTEAAERGQMMQMQGSSQGGEISISNDGAIPENAGYGALQRIINETGEIPREGMA